MSCRYYSECGRLCPRFIMTTAVTFADGTLTLTLPDTVTYADRCRYCIVIAQALPDGVTLDADVVAVIGTGTTEFPLVDRCGAPVTAQQVFTRRRYPVLVSTTATGGTIRVLCGLPCIDGTSLNALNDAAEGGAGA